MGRRIRWLGLALVLCFAAVLAQLVNIQLRMATSLNASGQNPRNAAAFSDNQRGLILAATGMILAKSVKTTGTTCNGYQYKRVDTTGSLYSAVVGYDSPCFYGTSGAEYAYNTYLGLHTQPATSLGELLNPPSKTTDNVTLTVNPGLQAQARAELNAIPDANKDGAIMVEKVTTGAILADYANPTYTTNPLATLTQKKVKAAGHTYFTTKDHEGFYPGYPLSTFDAFAPGSTFKVVTSSAVYNLKPSLENFTFPVAGCTKKGQIPQTTKQICNDATTPTAANPCGGTMVQMLPESCDPGYAMLGLSIGGTDLSKQARAFGYNQIPPIDLGRVVSRSNFPSPAELAPTGALGLPGVALSAFGQQTVTTTDLQNVMVASGIANSGNVMTPHVMAQIRNATGGLIESYKPTVYKHAESASAAKSVNQLMQGVATTPKGTAYGIFPSSLHIAVKTGTAQAGVSTTNTTDWMIGFAPAYDPKIAISVVVPYQAVSASGASIAGPIMRAMMTAALAAVPHNTVVPPTTSTSTTAPPTASTSTSSTSPPTTFPAATSTTSPPTTVPATTTTTTPGTGAPPTTGPTGAGAGGAVGAAPAVRSRRALVHTLRGPP